MKKRNQVTQAAVIAVAAVSSMSALAQETLTVQSTVTIDNSIDFAVVGNLDFGTLRAQANSDAGDCRGLYLAPSPSVTALAAPSATTSANYAADCPTGSQTSNSTLQAIGGTLTRPVFTINGVANFSNMNITVPSGQVALAAPLAPGAAEFILSDFKAWKITGGGTVNQDIPIDASGKGIIQANGSGTASFSLGATIRTDDNFTGQNYENNIAYVGDISVTVSY